MTDSLTVKAYFKMAEIIKAEYKKAKQGSIALKKPNFEKAEN